MSHNAIEVAVEDVRAADARRRLERCPYPILRRVRCAMHDDILVLTGVVPTFYAKQIAQELMRDLKRIAGIDNRLVVAN